jgi:predicted transcriptional regulator
VEFDVEQQTNFTCRVDADLKRAFLRAAKANDRPASVLIRDFMRGYVLQSVELQQGSLPLGEPLSDQRGASW